MLTMKKAPAIVLVLALVACGDQSTRDITSPRLSPGSLSGLSADRNAAGPEGMVAGHAEFISMGIPTSYRTEAKGDSVDAKGHFEIQQLVGSNQYRISGDVMCLAVVGTSARLAGHVAKSTNPDVRQGEFLVWSVLDNDAGPKHSPDMSSDFFLASERSVAQFHCDRGLTLPPMHAIKGRMEVRTKHAND